VFATLGIVTRMRCALCVVLSLAAWAVVGLSTGSAVAASRLGAPSASITGAGSGFELPELNQWISDTAGAPNNLQVSYTAQGATVGRQQFLSNSVDFAGTDIAFPPSEVSGIQNSPRCAGLAPQACFVYIPVSAGGLALMYNLVDDSGQRVQNLQLTRSAACGIFTGAITKWNDPQIVATNPQLAGLNRDIVPVLRADGAGESYVLSQFCIAVEPSVWNGFINLHRNDPNVSRDLGQGLPVSDWPQGWGHSTSALYADGVANAVADPVAGQNAITYVAESYAMARNNWPVASLQNALNVFTQPTAQNSAVAVGYASPSAAGDGTYILHYFGPDPRAYFPSTLSYVLAQTGGANSQKGSTLADFLCYSVTTGQANASALGYAALPANIVQDALSSIALIPGATQQGPCAVATPPPTLGEFQHVALALAAAGVPIAVLGQRRRRKLRSGPVQVPAAA
jgi:phosphate transport system substrate-binding protein